MKRMKLRDQFVLRIAWSPSLLGDQEIKNNKFFFYLKVSGGYTHMEEAKIKEKLEGNQNNSHILSHTYTTQKTNSKPIIPRPATSQTRGKEKVKNLPKMTIGPLSSLGSSTIVNDLS
jgi:hypothetical protein